MIKQLITVAFSPTKDEARIYSGKRAVYKNSAVILARIVCALLSVIILVSYILLTALLYEMTWLAGLIFNLIPVSIVLSIAIIKINAAYREVHPKPVKVKKAAHAQESVAPEHTWQ